jgi:hypothetical protein
LRPKSFPKIFTPFLYLPKILVMKIRTLFLFPVLMFTMAACSQRAYTPSLQLLSKEAKGSYQFLADGKGDSREDAEKDAKRRLLERLLYEGSQTSSITDIRLPLIENADKLSDKQSQEINSLLSKNNIDKYFTQVSWVDRKPVRAADGNKLQQFNLTVNYDLFRRDLESKGVLRKFGY